MIGRCFECRHGNCEFCWGVACQCLECGAADKDEFSAFEAPRLLAGVCGLEAA